MKEEPIASDDFQARLNAANNALHTFAPESRIERRPGGWYVCWSDYRGKEYARRWATRGQDFFPVWYDQWGNGGTASTALSQLIRWLQGRPVLPLGTWRYWSGERILLTTAETVAILEAAGYPTEVRCVVCDCVLDGPMDWWSHQGISGPCCDMGRGCQRR